MEFVENKLENGMLFNLLNLLNNFRMTSVFGDLASGDAVIRRLAFPSEEELLTADHADGHG